MRWLALVTCLLLLEGCAAPLLIGGAAATGVAVANDRRTAGTIVDDEGIELTILSEVARDQALLDCCHLNVTSYNGIVLLTGEAANTAYANRLVAIARKTNKVREVKNELSIGPKSEASSRNNDTLITSRVKTRLIQDQRIDGTAIKVVTEHATVYLMGLVTPAEANIAVDITRSTEGVMRIVKVFEYQS